MVLSCLTQKIEINYIIPAIRNEFIKILEKNFSDAEIARKLKITKAAVSQYKSGRRGKKLKFPIEIQKKIEKAVSEIIKGKNANAEISKIIDEIKECRYICKICKGCRS